MAKAMNTMALDLEVARLTKSSSSLFLHHLASLHLSLWVPWMLWSRLMLCSLSKRVPCRLGSIYLDYFPPSSFRGNPWDSGIGFSVLWFLFYACIWLVVFMGGKAINLIRGPLSLRPLEEANYIIGTQKERRVWELRSWSKQWGVLEEDPYALNILAVRPKLAISHTHPT